MLLKPKKSPTPKNGALAFVRSNGARTRKHKFASNLLPFVPGVLIGTIAQVFVYAIWVSTSRFLRLDDFVFAVFASGSPMIVGSLTLSIFRRHEAPIISATIVYSALFVTMVAVISAIRVQVSYSALIACYPIGLLCLWWVNSRFHMISRSVVRILPFSNAKDIEAMLPSAKLIAEDEIDALQRDPNFDVLLIDPSNHGSEVWTQFIATMYICGVDVIPWSVFVERHLGRVDVASFEPFHIAYSPSQILYSRAKRYLDLSAVIVFLPITLILGLLVALYIYLRDPGPVLFVQVRRGYGNSRFRMYKFRTMFQNTGGGSTVVGDNRVIPGCQFLRKVRLDELPQLYNIFCGDMSLIGPRPVAEYVAKDSIKAEAKYAYRCVVPPGITGWAQVTSGYAATVDEEIEKLSFDLYYVKHFSFDLDLIIIFKSIKTVLFGLGAR